MLETTHNGHPMVWNGHLCEGDQMVPFDRGTFLLWTRCGKKDVPANAAQASPDALSHVTCDECRTVYSEDAAHEAGVTQHLRGWIPATAPSCEVTEKHKGPGYICPDCKGPLGYVPTDPEQVCQKCFDAFEGLTIDELIDWPAPKGSNG